MLARYTDITESTPVPYLGGRGGGGSGYLTGSVHNILQTDMMHAAMLMMEMQASWPYTVCL